MSEPSEWTIMFLLAGDSGISSSMISQLKEITAAGFQRDTNVLVYFDPNCNGINARIFDVNKKRKKEFKGSHGAETFIGDGDDPFVRNIEEDCHSAGLKQIPAEESLKSFLNYSRTEFPAKNYILFLCGHGGIVANDEFLPDPDDDSAITLAELGTILRDFGAQVRAQEEKGEFHLVGMHSCSMSSLEVAYELQGSAKFMLASQGYAFPNSLPYRQLLKKIFREVHQHEAKPAPRAEPYPNKLIREIVDALQDLTFYNFADHWLAGYSSDITTCNLDKVGSIDSDLQGLAQALTAGMADPETQGYIVRAHLESQSYWSENYTDLYDLCLQLRALIAGIPDDEIDPGMVVKLPENEASVKVYEACKKVKDQLESDRTERRAAPNGAYDRPIVYSDYFGPAYQYSNGLSIYFPWRAPSDTTIETYKKYAFHKTAGADWLKFLSRYFEETQRKVRGLQPFKAQPANGNGRSPAAPLPEAEVVPYSEPAGASVGMLEAPDDKSGPVMGIHAVAGNGVPTLEAPDDKSGPVMAITAVADHGAPTLEPPDDKSGSAMAIISDKSGGAVGLFGLTVIKNFKNPTDAIVTSRPKAHPFQGSRASRAARTSGG
jgi:hypothetical protein